MLYKVGLCQFNPVFLEKKENFERIESLLRNVFADLIVLPELATSGYVFKSHEELEKVSEPAEGETYAFLKEIAREKNMSIVMGFPEKYKGNIYNSAMLVNPNGEQHVYKKIHLFYEEKKWFEPGKEGFKVYKAKNDVKVGLMVCFDWIFPESARSLAVQNAQIIAHPANLVLPWCQKSMVTRSIENRVFTITANRVGKECNKGSEQVFTGQSQITAPDGTVIKSLNKEEEKVITAEIIPQKADDKNVNEYNHIFNDRKKELYL